jgi:signal peptide peptidase SppA
MTRAFLAATSVPWAIRPEALQQILDIASRVHDPDFESAAAKLAARRNEIDFDAVSFSPGKSLPGAQRVRMRGNVAVMPVEGPIFRYSSLMTEMSGASSVESLAKDLRVVTNDPDVAAILLHVDSPGGEVNGIQEFSEALYKARGPKPIWAYVSNEGASAAYWIASACDRIVCAPTSLLGSIGVVAAVPDPSSEQSKNGRVQFVSSQSPNKRADPTTDAGKTQIQTVVDDLAQQFVQTVARNRSVDIDTVLQKFGAGGVMVGQKAVDSGLADSVGSFEQSLVDISSAATTQPSLAITDKEAKRNTSSTSESSIGAAQQDDAANLPDRQEGDRSMGLRERLLAAINGTPETEFEEQDTDTEGNTSVTTQTTSTNTVPAVTTNVAAMSTALELENRQLRERAVRLEEENVRIKAERMQERADSFWSRLFQADQAVPAEQSGIVRGYIQAAKDDELLPRPDGGSRVADFEAMYLARPKHMLQSEALPSALNDLIMLRPNMTTLRAGQTPAGQPMSEERRKELLEQTDQGRAVLEQRRNGDNSTPRRTR